MSTQPIPIANTIPGTWTSSAGAGAPFDLGGGALERLLRARTPLDELLGRPDDGAHGRGGASRAGGATHEVVRGDTLGELAARYGTTVEALAEANGIANPDLIHVGDTLIVPGPVGGPAGGADAGGTVGTGDGNGGATGVDGATGAAIDASDAEVRAVLDAMPPELRAAHPEAGEHVARILDEARAQGLTADQTAYVLASATHESNLGLHMEEFASGAAYEGRGDLGNTVPGDGMRFKGRGYVQITGRANYTDWSERLDVDLVADPGLATDPALAAKILVGGMREGTFTGVGLDDFIGPGRADFVGARAIVNGSDRAALIAGHAERYAAALASVPDVPA